MLNGKKFLLFLAMALVSAISLTGCGGGGGGSSAPTTGSLKFDNSAATVGIDEVYAALSTDTTWGAKRNSSAITAGASWTLAGLAPSTYDARVISNGAVSSYYAYAYSFPITAGNTYTLTVNNSSYTGSLIITNNNATYPITAVYVSATTLGGGVNQISTSIAPNTSRQIVGIPAGSYYVRAVQNGLNRDNSGVAIASYSYSTLTYN
jgi:hypothetical protein